MKGANRLVLAALAGAALWVGVASAGPRVEVEGDDEVRFGVAAPGEAVEARFRLRNTGDETLRILDVQTGCACTIAEHPDTIEPGEVGVILAKVDTMKVRGEFGRGVVVDTNDPDHRKLVLSVKGAVISSATLLPHEQIQLNNLEGPEVIARRLVRANPLDNGVLEVTGIETTAPWLAVTARRLDGPLPKEMRLPQSRDGDWLLEVRVQGEMVYGAHSERLRFDTGLERQPWLEVPVYARLLPPVNLSTSTLVLAGDDPTAVRETFYLSVRVGLAPGDLRVEAEPEALRVELEPAGGSNFKAHVRWTDEQRENGTIRFRIGDESYPLSVQWDEAGSSANPVEARTLAR